MHSWARLALLFITLKLRYLPAPYDAFFGGITEYQKTISSHFRGHVYLRQRQRTRPLGYRLSVTPIAILYISNHEFHGGFMIVSLPVGQAGRGLYPSPTLPCMHHEPRGNILPPFCKGCLRGLAKVFVAERGRGKAERCMVFPPPLPPTMCRFVFLLCARRLHFA